MYTLDTNAIIYYLKDDANAVFLFRDIFNKNIPIYVSAITEVELFGFPGLNKYEAENIDLFLETVTIIPVDSRLARIAGSLRRSHKLKIPDSVIAATALLTGTTLITRNSHDFKHIPNLPIMIV